MSPQKAVCVLVTDRHNEGACFITWRNTHQGLVHFQRHNDVHVISQWYRHLFKYATVECHSSRCIIRREVTLLKHQFVRWCRSTFAWVHCILLQKKKNITFWAAYSLYVRTLFQGNFGHIFFRAVFFFNQTQGSDAYKVIIQCGYKKKESAYFGKSSPHFAVNRLLKGEI